jgi:hypothetical protein
LGSVLQISLVMDKFESQFADLDVQTSYMESTMSDTTALTTPQDQVDQLINQVADEAGLEIQHGLGEVKVPAQAVEAGKEENKEEDGKLAERLRALRVSRLRGTRSGRSRFSPRAGYSRRRDREISRDIWKDLKHQETSRISQISLICRAGFVLGLTAGARGECKCECDRADPVLARRVML